MEEHRLKPMVKHDPKVFKYVYEKTKRLKYKLASQIDHRRLQLSFEDVVSAFDVKLLFVFNKYYEKHTREVLLGHVIQGLSMMKYRIMRAAYTEKYTQNIVNMGEETEHYEDILHDTPEYISNRDLYYDLAMSFMKQKLSENAFEVFQIQLNPPPFILHRLIEEDLPQTKIPSGIIAEYFDMEQDSKSLNYIDALKKEINKAIKEAREFYTS